MPSLSEWAKIIYADKDGRLGGQKSQALAELRRRAAGVGQTFAQFIEPTLTVASGLAGSAVGGVVGAAGLPFGVDVAANAVKRTQDWMTYVPRTEGGQKGLETVSNVMGGLEQKVNTATGIASGALTYGATGDVNQAAQVGGKVYQEGLGNVAGEYVTDKTGSPLLGTMTKMVPDIADAFLGSKAAAMIPGKQFTFGDIGSQQFGQRGAVGGVTPQNTPPAVTGSYLDQNWQDRMLTKEKYDALNLTDSSFGTTRADLTTADPQGIKSLGGATFDTPIPAEGGPGYSDMFGLGWAARETGGTGKLIQNDFLVPTAMTPDSHKSNATITTTYTTALHKNIENGWVSPNTIKEIEAELSTKFADVPTGGSPKEFNDWLDTVTFEKRSAVMTMLRKAKFEGKGLPDVNRLLNQTLDKGASGAYPTEAMTLIKNDPDAGIVKLGEDGYPTHLSYKYGTKGTVEAVFPPGMKESDLHPGDWSKYVESSTKKGRPSPQADAAYTFSRGWYGSKFGESIRDLLPNAEDIKGGKQVNSRSFNAAMSTLSNDWSSIQQGGKAVGLKDFVRSMDTNEGGATLSQISEKDIKQLVKDGKAKIFQLGTGDKAQDIKFMIKKDSYNWADDSLPDEEWVLSSVLNNETGVKGIAAEAILHKAMQEGVTALDAFDVPGAYGLPKIYGKYGFSEAKRLPFDKGMFLDDAAEFYINQNKTGAGRVTPKIRKEAKSAAEQRLADAENFWRSQGWDESKGHPDVVIMRKELDENANESIKQLYSGALDGARNRGGNISTGGGSERALPKQQEFADRILAKPKPTKGAGVESTKQSVSNTDSILPSSRRSSVVDTFTSGMQYPTLNRMALKGLKGPQK